jgi:CO/xanthine dehydrogenase FAD-binding subunit
VAGHVRIAISSVTCPPIRMVAAEQRLERRVIAEPLIEAAIAASRADLPTPLTQIEQAELVEVLKGFIK